MFTTTESVGFTAAATEAAYVVAVAAQPLNAEKGVCDAARGLTNSVLVSLTFGSLAPTAAEQARAGGRSMVVADHTGKRRVACCLRLPSQACLTRLATSAAASRARCLTQRRRATRVVSFPTAVKSPGADVALPSACKGFLTDACLPVRAPGSGASLRCCLR